MNSDTIFCSRCASFVDVGSRSFKRSYVPVAAYCSLLLGPLIGLLVILACRVQHDITLPFCKNCWKGVKKANALEMLSVLAFIASLIVGLVLLLNFNSGIAFLPPVIVAVAFVIWAQLKKHRSTLKFIRVDKNQAVVDAGKYGQIIFAKTTTASTRPVEDSWSG